MFDNFFKVWSVFITLIAIALGVNLFSDSREDVITELKIVIEEQENTINTLNEQLISYEEDLATKDNQIQSLQEEILLLNDDIYSLTHEIIRLEELLKPIEEIKQESAERFNNEILGMIGLVKMNPDIFEKDEDGYLKTQYLLNVIEINDMMSREYGHLQMMLYELTGEHDPIRAIDIIRESYQQ